MICLVRTVKDPEVRKNEFVDAAEILFSKKGYESTSVKDIVEKMGVAHGLFYYYFDSKEAVMDAIVHRLVDDLMSDLRGIATAENLDALGKFKRTMLHSIDKKKEKPYLISIFLNRDEPFLLSKYMDRTMDEFTPLMTSIVEQGIKEGVFKTKYPRYAVEFWLHGRLFVFWNIKEEYHCMFDYLKAEAHFLELIFEVQDDALSSFWDEYFDKLKDMITLEDVT
ncbi:MAG: TetR/AcrR family transcriptional regulator [Thermoplasmata archaeon]